MTNEIKSIFINTVGTISYLIVIFFFVTLIMFIHNDVKDALKEAWVASIYFLSSLCTLVAAYIASKLFNDWKDQHNKSIFAQEAKELLVLVNSDILIYTKINTLLKNLDENKHPNSCQDYQDFIDKITETGSISTNKSEKALLLVALTDDIALEKLRLDYQLLNVQLLSNIVYMTQQSNTKVKDVKVFYEKHIKQIINLNVKYKAYLKKYVLA